MKKLLRSLSTVALIVPMVSMLILAMWALPVSADGNGKKIFIALINGGQETPPVTAGNAFGVAFMTFDEESGELCYSINFTALVAAETAAHFHGPAVPGEPAGVLIDISPRPPGPSPLGSPKTGCVGPLEDEHKEFLESGLLYINIHSTTFPGGEIRGQVLPH